MWTATNSCSDSETRPGAQLMSGREARSSKAAFTHICGLGRPVSMRRQRTNVLRGPAAHLERQAFWPSHRSVSRVHLTWSGLVPAWLQPEPCTLCFMFHGLCTVGPALLIYDREAQMDTSLSIHTDTHIYK